MGINIIMYTYIINMVFIQCNTTRDIFSLVEGKKDAYAEMSIGHKIISIDAETVLTSDNSTIAAPAAEVNN